MNSGDGYDMNKEIDYNMILMQHLSRLSIISVGLGEQEINISGDIMNARIKSLEWGVHFLYCMMPKNYIDKEFRADETKFLELAKTNEVRAIWLKYWALINLMNRRGLLMGKDSSGSKAKASKNNPEEVFEK